MSESNNDDVLCAEKPRRGIKPFDISCLAVIEKLDVVKKWVYEGKSAYEISLELKIPYRTYDDILTCGGEKWAELRGIRGEFAKLRADGRKRAMAKKAQGFVYSECEYDGKGNLIKETKKYQVPDHSAMRLLLKMDKESEFIELKNDELQAEKTKAEIERLKGSGGKQEPIEVRLVRCDTDPDDAS